MEIFKNEVFVRINFLILGSIIGAIVGKIKNKSKKLIYKVNTQQIAVSAQDAIFGNVKVLWRDTPVNNLYFTTVTIENISTTDFKDINFKVYTTKEIKLLTEATKIVGTTYILNWSPAYKKRLVPIGGQVTGPRKI